MDNCSLEYFFGTSKSLIDFGAELEELSNEQCLKKDRNESVKYDLSTSFKNVYQGEFRVVLYGSRASGLATRDSADLDILFDTSRSNNVPINNIERENWMLNKIAKFMKNKGGGKWSNMEKIFCCRRPILKVTHAPTQMHCDITVMSSLGVSNTQMMSLYMKHIPLLRQMILVVREWSNRFEFTKDINNYGLSLLVLFYLQIINYASSVSDLRFNITHCEVDISGYDFLYYDNIDNINSDVVVKRSEVKTLPDLLLGFYTYYSLFDYENDVICPLVGRPIKKKYFEKKYRKKLPPEMYTYIKIVRSGGEPLKITKTVLQDPIDLSHNIAKKTRKNFVEMFTNNCSRIATLLQKT